MCCLKSNGKIVTQHGYTTLLRMCNNWKFQFQVLVSQLHLCHTHTFHPLSAIVIHTFNKVWMTILENGWNVWVWLVGLGGIYGCG